MTNGLPVLSGGFDSDMKAARQKCYFEAVERICFLNAKNYIPRRKWTPRIASKATAWKNYSWYNPDQLKKYKETARLKDPKEVAWVPTTCLFTGKQTFVPEFTLANSSHPYFTEDTSNGWALGSTPEMALEHAILELLERDAFLYSWYSKKSPTRLNVPFEILKAHRMASAEKQLGGKNIFLRFPAPWGVHVIGTATIRNKKPYFLMGLAASLDPLVALKRSFQEAMAFYNTFKEPTNELRLFKPIIPEYHLHHPNDRLQLYGYYKMKSSTDFLFRGAKADFESLPTYYFKKLKEELKREKQQVSIFETEVKAEGNKKFYLTKAISPTLIGIEFIYRHRNLGSPRLKHLKRINPDPHPFS